MSRGWIAGPYVFSWNGLTVGITDDGMNLNYSYFGDKVKGDNLGDSTQDYVYRGADVYCDGVFNEWETALIGVQGENKTKQNLGCAFWPMANMFGNSGAIGRLASAFAAPLIGVPSPFTTAASALVKNLTIPYAVLPPNYNIAQLFAARLRSVPIRFQGLPYPQFAADARNNVAADAVWFTLLNN